MVNFNIIDIIIVLIILFNLFRGWSKGLVLSLGGVISLIISWVISKRYYKSFSTYLTENIDWIQELKADWVYKINNSFTTESQLKEGISDGSFFKALDIPTYFERGINQMIMDSNLGTSNNINQEFAEIIISALMNILSFILLFIIILLVIKLILLTIDAIFTVPVLNEINKFGGMLFGFVIANFTIFLLMAIIVILIPLGLDFGLKESIEGSALGEFYYNNNLILYLINYYL